MGQIRLLIYDWSILNAHKGTSKASESINLFHKFKHQVGLVSISFYQANPEREQVRANAQIDRAGDTEPNLQILRMTAVLIPLRLNELLDVP